jgi:alkylmercury lyase
MSPFVSDTTEEEKIIRKAAFHAILEGAPLNRDGLADATGLTREKVDVSVDSLAERGLIVVKPASGRIVGSCGLSSEPTSHRLQIRGRELHTWCAEDAVGIPAALGEDASVVSQCHHCGVTVKIEMSAGQVGHVEPPGVQLWIAATEVGRSVVGFT